MKIDKPKITYILIQLLIISFFVNFTYGKESLKNERANDERQIRNISLNLINYIINKNTKQILKLLPMEGKIQYREGDRYKTRKEIENGLLNQEYEYAYLFDTNKSQKFFSKFVCIRDQILELKDRNLRIKEIDFNEIDPTIVHVYFTWEGKSMDDSILNFNNFVFQLEKGEWKLASLVFHI